MEGTPPAGWTRQGDALVRTITRADFVDALGFILAVAGPAERANHHPDIDLRYDTVRLSLSTHSAGHKVTGKDFRLAEAINHLTEEQIGACTAKLRHHLRS